MARPKKTASNSTVTVGMQEESLQGTPKPLPIGSDQSDREFLEIEKLKLEVKYLRSGRIRPADRPAAIHAVSTVTTTLVVSAFTFLFAWSTGFLDQKRDALQARTDRLEMRASELEFNERDTEARLKSREGEILSREAELAALSRQIRRTHAVKDAERRLVEVNGVVPRIVPGSDAYEVKIDPFIDWSMGGDSNRDPTIWPKRESVFRDLEILPEVRTLRLEGVLADEDSLLQLASVPVTGEVMFIDNGLTDARMKKFPLWRGLTRLTLGEQPLSSPGRLVGFENLKYLDLSATDLTDAGIEELRPLVKTLEELRLNETKITDASVAILKGASRLQSLHIRGCNISKDGVLALRLAPSIRFISVKPGAYTEEQLREFNKAPGECRVLALEVNLYPW